ncbi:MAG: hypothetical protein IPM35_14495 [Myxococcales bacterium]|nr:hypothetical protein [Myxococcales bacterium]
MQLRVRLPLLLAAALAASSPAFAQPPVETPTADSPDEASKLFKKGNEAYKLKKWEEAAAAFKEAWALKQSYDIAGNLGDVEVYLGKYRDAAEHLEFSLRNWPAGQEASKKRTQERFAEAKKNVGTLSLKVSEGAEITVNGKPIGKSPLPGPVFIEPGAATIEAKIGEKSAKKTVALDVGEAREIELTIEGEAAAVGPEPAPAAGGPSEPDPGAGGGIKAVSSGMKPRTLALIAGAGLTVVAAGVGVFYTLKKSSAQDDADGLRSELSSKFGGQACSGSSAPAQCADLTDALERRDDAGRISTGAFIASGVLLAATAVTYFVWPSGHESSPKAGRLNIFATPQARGAMMGVVGSF